MKICFSSLASFFIGVVRYCTSFQWSNVVFTRLPQVVVHLITISVNGRMCLTMTENGILLLVTPLQKEQGLNTIAMEMVKKLLVPHLHIKKKVNCILPVDNKSRVDSHNWTAMEAIAFSQTNFFLTIRETSANRSLLPLGFVPDWIFNHE